MIFTTLLRRNLAAKGDEPGEILNNISTCVILDFKELGLVHCSQKMMDQMQLYIGNIFDVSPSFVHIDLLQNGRCFSQEKRDTNFCVEVQITSPSKVKLYYWILTTTTYLKS